MADVTPQNQSNLIQYYEKSPDYKTIYATGIFGGPTMNGLMCINFIADIPPLPITTESEPRGNRLVQIKADFGGKQFIREVQCSVLLNTDTANLLIEWLTNNLKTLQTLQNANANPK